LERFALKLLLIALVAGLLLWPTLLNLRGIIVQFERFGLNAVLVHETLLGVG
jgi:hypothetical protein